MRMIPQISCGRVGGGIPSERFVDRSASELRNRESKRRGGKTNKERSRGPKTRLYLGTASGDSYHTPEPLRRKNYKLRQQKVETRVSLNAQRKVLEKGKGKPEFES